MSDAAKLSSFVAWQTLALNTLREAAWSDSSVNFDGVSIPTCRFCGAAKEHGEHGEDCVILALASSEVLHQAKMHGDVWDVVKAVGEGGGPTAIWYDTHDGTQTFCVELKRREVDQAEVDDAAGESLASAEADSPVRISREEEFAEIPIDEWEGMCPRCGGDGYYDPTQIDLSTDGVEATVVCAECGEVWVELFPPCEGVRVHMPVEH